MKVLSELTIRKIAGLIAVSPQAFNLPACYPNRPPGGYRTWPSLIAFLKSVDPLVPKSEEGLTNFIYEINGTPKEDRFDLQRESATRELLKIWNKKDPDIFLKVFEQLLDSDFYFGDEQAEILRVFGVLNTTLNEEGLFLGGFPLKVIETSKLSVDEKAKMEWEYFWFLASRIFLTNTALRDKASSLMLQGCFNDVVRNAAELPFDLLRNKFKSLKSKDGEKLITAALRKDGILFYNYTDSNIEDWARKRLAAKLSALYQAYRNPSSHDYRIENPWEAILAVWNANWCMGEIEKLSEKTNKNDIPF